MTIIVGVVGLLTILECKAVISKKSDFTVYKSRRVPFSLFVNIPLTTPRINFRISECHHRFSIDLIIIFSAKNGNSKKNTLGPY